MSKQLDNQDISDLLKMTNEVLSKIKKSSIQ